MPLKEKSIVVPQSPFLYYLIQYQSFWKAGKNWEKLQIDQGERRHAVKF